MARDNLNEKQHHSLQSIIFLSILNRLKDPLQRGFQSPCFIWFPAVDNLYASVSCSDSKLLTYQRQVEDSKPGRGDRSLELMTAMRVTFSLFKLFLPPPLEELKKKRCWSPARLFLSSALIRKLFLKP